jgi:hypothetical protein
MSAQGAQSGSWELRAAHGSSERLMGAQSGSAKLTMAQGRSSIETYHVSTLERPELPTKTAEPWWPLRFADKEEYFKIVT